MSAMIADDSGGWWKMLRPWIVLCMGLVAGAREKRSLCTSGNVCFAEEVGCIPCVYNLESYTPEKMNMIFYLYSDYAFPAEFTWARRKEGIQNATVKTDRDMWVIIHGFEGQWPLEWLELMKGKLKDQGNTVMVARWSDGTVYPTNYPQAAVNGLTVGKMTALVIEQLSVAKGLSLDRVHLIGFSLGVHVAGHVGAALGGRVRQIVGLDPPEKLYEGKPIEQRLDPSDAQLVQVIHTHGASLLKGGLGTLIPMGDVDIYVNGGEEQPGCPISERKNFDISRWYDVIKVLGCNHIRSTALFTDSISNSACRYQTYACANEDEWSRGQCFTCPKEGCLQLGYHMNTTTKQRGKFWINTLIDQGVNEPNKAYCGTQYRLTLFPDKKVKGIIDVTIKDGSYSTQPHRFQERDNTLYLEGRSNIITAGTASPKKLKLEYNRQNYLVKKSAFSFNLIRAVLLRDDGTAFEFRGVQVLEDDYSSEVGLNATTVDVKKFLADTRWTSAAPSLSASLVILLLCLLP